MKRKSIIPRASGRRTFWPIHPGLFGLALGVLCLGYGLLLMGPADSLASRTFAPVALVAGYCVLMPLAIVRSRKPFRRRHGGSVAPAVQRDNIAIK